MIKFLFLVLPLLLISNPMGWAQTEGAMSKLFAPGPLIIGHMKLEEMDCLKCHDAGKGVPDQKCMDCHKAIRPFVEEKRGFHGLANQACIKCHSEHKGRQYDSANVDEKTFKHKEQTGYALDGKHAGLKCSECHALKRTNKVVRTGEIRYFGQTTSCVSCHKKDDVHFFKGKWAKKDCNTCHTSESWTTKLTFSHEKDARYKLSGQHLELKCSECHIQKNTKSVSIYKWQNLKTQKCMTCHADVHKGKMTARFAKGNCASCHSEVKWTIPKFNHSITKYKLTGKHSEINCSECHVQKPELLGQKDKKNWVWKGLTQKCLSCHKDEHRFGKHEIKKFAPINNCNGCHNDTSWKQIHNFDHNMHTRYKVDGKHETLKCAQCHLTKDAKSKPVVWLNPGIYKWNQLTNKTCENCHKSPHIGVFSKKQLQQRCTECHTTEGWNLIGSDKKFDHSKTRFPITGAHKSAACADCHKIGDKQIFKYRNYNTGFCMDCHKSVHTNMFHGKFDQGACASCHTDFDFQKRLDFDHSKTRMTLNGAHKTLDCNQCHTAGNKKMLLTSPNVNKKKFPSGKIFTHSSYIFEKLPSSQCLTCHNDVHKGQVGADCLKCHTESEWKISHFDHNEKTKFALKGEHKEVACKECHKPITRQTVKEFRKVVAVINYTQVPKTCNGCHKDPHRGSYGTSCTDCHSEAGWQRTKDFHKNFTLNGVHYSLSCTECHRDGRKLAGLSQQCISCHQKDDVHFGTLPSCQDCHRQQFWEVSSFRHSLTQFPLRGSHRTLDCAQCHRSGVYQGLNNECITCHLNDALTVTAPVHAPIGSYTECSQCHKNHFSFGGAN